MANQKLIFVTGGTGKQGGAVARELAKKGFKVKVLTRKPDAAPCSELKRLGIECVKGNLDEVDTYREYVRSAYGVFSVQTFEKGTRKEIEQGKTLANLAYQFGVKHFIYSSVAGAGSQSGIPHFESKFVIEEHIKKIGLPYTILRPASLYENFLFPQVKKGISKGKLVQPTNATTSLQFVSCEDIGKVAVRAFLNPDVYLSQTITLVSEDLTTVQVADLFSEELKMPVVYKKAPWIFTRFILSKDVNRMFNWFNKGNRMADMEQVYRFRENEDPVRLRDWIGQNFKPHNHTKA